jgi:hypothetical protein
MGKPKHKRSGHGGRRPGAGRPLGSSRSAKEQSGAQERIQAIVAGSTSFSERYYAGDPEAVAAYNAVGSPEERQRAKEAYASAIEVWRNWRAPS